MSRVTLLMHHVTNAWGMDVKHQQKVSLRMGIAWLASTHSLETVQGVHFTSEYKLKVMFKKLQVNTKMAQFSSYFFHFRGAIFTSTWKRISALIPLDLEWKQTMKVKGTLFYRVHYINSSAKCFITDSAVYTTENTYFSILLYLHQLFHQYIFLSQCKTRLLQSL
jgi:hypothetical protein